MFELILSTFLMCSTYKEFWKKLVFSYNFSSASLLCWLLLRLCVCVYNKRLPWNDNKMLLGGRANEKSRTVKDRVAINSCIWCFNEKYIPTYIECVDVYLKFIGQFSQFTLQAYSSLSLNTTHKKIYPKNIAPPDFSNLIPLMLWPPSLKNTKFYVTTRLRTAILLESWKQNIDPKKFWNSKHSQFMSFLWSSW